MAENDRQANLRHRDEKLHETIESELSDELRLIEKQYDNPFFGGSNEQCDKERLAVSVKARELADGLIGNRIKAFCPKTIDHGAIAEMQEIVREFYERHIATLQVDVQRHEKFWPELIKTYASEDTERTRKLVDDINRDYHIAVDDNAHLAPRDSTSAGIGVDYSEIVDQLPWNVRWLPVDAACHLTGVAPSIIARGKWDNIRKVYMDAEGADSPALTMLNRILLAIESGELPTRGGESETINGVPLQSDKVLVPGEVVAWSDRNGINVPQVVREKFAQPANTISTLADSGEPSGRWITMSEGATQWASWLLSKGETSIPADKALESRISRAVNAGIIRDNGEKRKARRIDSVTLTAHMENEYRKWLRSLDRERERNRQKSPLVSTRNPQRDKI